MISAKRRTIACEKKPLNKIAVGGNADYISHNDDDDDDDVAVDGNDDGENCITTSVWL